MVKRPRIGRRIIQRERVPQGNRNLSWLFLLALGALIVLLVFPLFPGAWQEWITTRQREVEQVKSEVATTFEDESLGGAETPDLNKQLILLPSSDLDHPQGRAPDLAASSEDSSRSTLTLGEELSLKLDMLDLINLARESAGLTPVSLGVNSAAQAHADDMLNRGYLSHWGIDGLKPYMRYTIAGGEDYVVENISGPAGTSSASNQSKIDSKESIRQTHAGLMNSPGHRRNILDKWKTTVNLGIACNDYSCAVAQQFERDYVHFGKKPNMLSGILTLTGVMPEEFQLVQVDVWYDQPPEELSMGQLDTTESYRIGQRPAAFVRPPPPAGSSYVDESVEYSWQVGADPYSVSPNTPRAGQQDREPSSVHQREPTVSTITVPLITAGAWDSGDGLFRVAADLRPVLAQLGAGVYTVIVWGETRGEAVALTSYAVFVG